MENEETLDPQDQKVNPAYQVCLASQETKEKEGTRVPWVIRVIEDLMEYQEMMDHQVCLVYQVKWGQEDFLVQEVLVVCQDPLEFLELRAAKEPKATRVLQVPQDHLVKLEVKDPLGDQVQLVHLVHQDKQVQEENQACPAYQDRMELLEIQEIQDKLVPKVILVLPEMLALLDSLDPVVSKATTVRGAQQVSTVRRAKEATRASREIWVKKVIVDSLVPWVKQENLGHKEPKVAKDPGVKLELLDLKGTKAKLDPQAFQDILEDLETRVIKASKEVMGFLVPKVNEAGMVQ